MVARTRRPKKNPRRKVQARKARRRKLLRKKVPPRKAPEKKALPKKLRQKSQARTDKRPMDSGPPQSGSTKRPSPRRLLQSLLQLPDEVIVDHVKQVSARVRAGDAVRFIGINHQPELLSRFDQRVDHLHAVLK